MENYHTYLELCKNLSLPFCIHTERDEFSNIEYVYTVAKQYSDVNFIANSNIIVGDYTMYNDFVNDPTKFENNNVLYHYPANHDKLIIGKYCSIACGAKFMFTSGNHKMESLSTYPFPLFYEEWGLNGANITDARDNNGDIVIGNDVWIG